MTEPLGIQNIFIGTMSGAAIVLLGALYALFFALGRLRRNHALSLAGLTAYALMVIAVYALVVALGLDGIWISVAAVMVVGYFLAPRAIWRLCVGTHADEDAGTNKGATQ